MRSIVLILLALLLISFSSRPQGQTREMKSFVSPPKDIKLFALGYDEDWADSIWLRVIQDIEICDRTSVGDLDMSQRLPKSDDHNGPIPAGGWSNHDAGRCRDESWVFTMLDAVTKLAPRFRIPYSAGATILAVVVRDYKGATVIFERGLHQFPNDWQLEYKAAFHYLYNLGDQNHAADLLVQAAKNGGPQWLYSLAAKLYTEEGQAFMAKTVLQEVLDENPDAQFAVRLKQRLDEADQVLKKQANPADFLKAGSRAELKSGNPGGSSVMPHVEH